MSQGCTPNAKFRFEVTLDAHIVVPKLLNDVFRFSS